MGTRLMKCLALIVCCVLTSALAAAQTATVNARLTAGVVVLIGGETLGGVREHELVRLLDDVDARAELGSGLRLAHGRSTPGLRISRPRKMFSEISSAVARARS